MNGKIKGFRKLGIAMTAICSISYKLDMPHDKAVIIAVIAIVAIICQCILDWRK